jgi:hypothetical protein
VRTASPAVDGGDVVRSPVRAVAERLAADGPVDVFAHSIGAR